MVSEPKCSAIAGGGGTERAGGDGVEYARRRMQRSRTSRLVLVPAALALAWGCSAAPPARVRPQPPAAPGGDSLGATLWIQTAAEAELLSEATFAAATRAVELAVAAADWSALDQGPAARELPPAVIADVDETLLDNSPYEAARLRAGREFEPASWDAWVRRASAAARPGALAFARRAEALGVTLFYVTNRDRDQEAATRENLERAGFPLRTDLDTVLVEGERADWGRDKESRRAAVARSHRVLLLLGDDLNDFVSAARSSLEERRALAERHRERFGKDWFLFANPVYGSWRRALEGYASGLSAAEARRLRALHLRGAE